MIMKVAKELEPPSPLGLSYVLNIETLLGSILNTFLLLGLVRDAWSVDVSRKVGVMVEEVGIASRCLA